jgi:glycosyltransferase involved in cell wall biosynthesis
VTAPQQRRDGVESDPLPILHVVRPATGGIRRHVLSLLEFGDRSRFEPALAAPAEFLASIAPARATATYAVPIAPSLSPGTDFVAALALSRPIADAGLVHAHGLRAAWITSLAHLRRPFPLIVTAHNLVPRGSFLSRAGLQLVGGRASRIIAVSQAVADGLTNCGVPPSKIVVIPNGIDIEHFTAVPALGTARAALGVSDADFVVGCIARLSPEKGVDILLSAAARCPSMMFLIAGDGPKCTELEQSAPPNARFLGRISDTRLLLGASDVLAIPSRQEGQGIVALEAMAARIPLAASRVGGLAEMLTDGRTALLFPPDDPSALAAALFRLQKDAPLRRNLAAGGAALVRERYAISPMIDAVQQVYQEI